MIHSRLFRSLIAIAALCLASSGFAQILKSWAQSYGVGSYGGDGRPTSDANYGSGFDKPVGIAKMPDGGFVVGGYVDLPKHYTPWQGNPNTLSRAEATLVRFAPDGTVLWQRGIHTPTDRTDYSGTTAFFYPGSAFINKIATDAQGNIFVSGTKRPNPSASIYRPFVAKFSPAGDLIWQNGIEKAAGTVNGSPWENALRDAVDMSVTADGGLVVALPMGRPGQVYTTAAVAKFASNGAVSQFFAFEEADQYAPDLRICQSLDGTRLVTARYFSFSNGGTGSPRYGMALIVTDMNGNIISQHAWDPFDDRNEDPVAVIATADGGYAVLSELGTSGTTILRKINSAGTQATFERMIKPLNQSARPFYASSLAQTADGGFLIGGMTSSPEASYSMGLMKMSAGGALEFVNLLGGPQNEATAGETFAVQAADGGYAFTTATNSYKTGIADKPDWWIGKTDASRRVSNFTGDMIDRPLSDFTVQSGPNAHQAVTVFSVPAYTAGAVSNLNPPLVILDPERFEAPNVPIVRIQASSPRIVSPANAEAVVEQHFSYHVLATFFPAGAALTYSASGLPGNFVIHPVTGVISGNPQDGSQTTTPIQIQLHVSDGTNSVDGSLALTIGDGAPVLRVNGSDTPGVYTADQPFSFVVRQPGALAGRVMAIEYSTSANPNSWLPLANGTLGVMAYDFASRAYVLSSTSFPLVNGVQFRARLLSPGRTDDFSNPVGTFNFATGLPRLGKTQLFISRNGPVANIRFGVTQENPPAGIAVKVQETKTPAVEGSWTDVPSGTLTQDSTAPKEFYRGFDDYPEGEGIYFRAVAKAANYADSFSGANGPVKFIFDPAATVTLSSPSSGGSNGVDYDNPILQESGVGFNITAQAQTGAARSIAKLSLVYDGDTIQMFASSNGNTPYQSNAPGDHLVEAIAVDDLGVIGDARPRHLRVGPPAPGRILYATAAGDWSDASIWTDGQGNHAVPGSFDLAVIGPVDVRLTSDVSVRAFSMNGGTLDTVAGVRKKLSVAGFCTVGSGKIKSDVEVLDGGRLLFLNDVDVQLTGTVTNRGIMKLLGKGGITGGQAAMAARAGKDLPDWGFPDVLGAVRNFGQWLFSRPAGGRSGSTTPPAPPPNPTPAPDVRKVVVATVENSGAILAVRPPGTLPVPPPLPPVIGNRAGGLFDANGNPLVAQGAGNLVAQGGGNLVAQGAGNLVAQGGGNLVAQGAGNLVAQGAGNLVAQGAGNLVATGGGNLIAQGAGNAIATPQGAPGIPSSAPSGGTPGFVQSGGATNLNDIMVVGAITLDGGSLTGAGTIVGDLTNNAGSISAGSSPGLIGITGALTQNGGGTLIIEAAGAEANQFDQLQVGSSTTLGGTLDLRMINGFTPLAQDPFVPLGYASVSGAFSAVTSNTQIGLGATGLVSTLDPAAAPPPTPVVLETVLSRKTHGTAGEFDIHIWTPSSSSVECRSAGANGAHTLVLTFNSQLVSGNAAITGGSGSISGTPSIAGTTMTIPLTGVQNAQQLTVSLSGVTNTSAQVMSPTPIAIGFLVGDTSGNGSVNATDIGQTKAQSGQPVSTSNFRNDVTVNGGAISASDIGLVKSSAGTQLP